MDSTAPTRSFAHKRRRLTDFEQALADRLHESGLPIVTPYLLFQEMRALYASGKKYRLRKHRPDHEDLRLRRHNLVRNGVLIQDPDYGNRAYRIVANSDRAADEIVCLVDRFCYVSHLSAIARYGLTNRRPTALHVTAPSRHILSTLIRNATQADYGADTLRQLDHDEIVPLRGVTHPDHVRRRPLKIHLSSHLGESLEVRSTFTRLSTIGQTFLDMLDRPSACGGMPHVIEIWNGYAALYLDDIIEAIGKSPSTITKVRAGYLLEEHLGINDDRIERWVNHAQRGGSRVLDPERPFSSAFSEKWMLSINVG